MTKIMTIHHPRWVEFLVELDRCLEKNGGCDNKLTYSTKLLSRFAADVNGSLDFLRKHGGYCDCEVLMNVDAGWEDLQQGYDNGTGKN